MSYIIVGLGNPGQEYEKTRHNTGRMVLDVIRKEFGDDFKSNSKMNADVATGKVDGEKVVFMAPNTFMNNSGKAIGYLVKSVKAAEKLIVIYDDFNLPLGRIRISWNRSSGGHNGLESIIRSVKTEKFIRIRVGTAPENAKGNAKTPHGDDKIEKFILGKFKDGELTALKKVAKDTIGAIEAIIAEGRDKAMSIYNAS